MWTLLSFSTQLPQKYHDGGRWNIQSVVGPSRSSQNLKAPKNNIETKTLDSQVPAEPRSVVGWWSFTWSILMWNRCPLTLTTAHSSFGTKGSGSSANSRGMGVTVLEWDRICQKMSTSYLNWAQNCRSRKLKHKILWYCLYLYLVIVGLESFVLVDTEEYRCLDDAAKDLISFLWLCASSNALWRQRGLLYRLLMKSLNKIVEITIFKDG